MPQKPRVKMSKPNGRDSIATANVLPEHVNAWEEKGWSKDQKSKEEDK